MRKIPVQFNERIGQQLKIVQNTVGLLLFTKNGLKTAGEADWTCLNLCNDRLSLVRKQDTLSLSFKVFFVSWNISYNCNKWSNLILHFSNSPPTHVIITIMKREKECVLAKPPGANIKVVLIWYFWNTRMGGGGGVFSTERSPDQSTSDRQIFPILTEAGFGRWKNVYSRSVCRSFGVDSVTCQ